MEKLMVELDSRENSDEKVQLLWDRPASNIYIRLTDKHEGTISTRRVPNSEARQAFLHPYVYCDF